MIRPRSPLPLGFETDPRFPFSKSWLNRFFAIGAALWSEEAESSEGYRLLQSIDGNKVASEDVALMRKATLTLLRAGASSDSSEPVGTFDPAGEEIE